jgi:hypothetical protein
MSGIEKNQPTCEFVVLGHAQGSLDAALTPVGIVVRELGWNSTPELRLYVPAVLGTTLSQPHLDYLHELFQDWRSTPNEGLDALFSELRELSSGPLRAQESGRCSMNELPGLVNRVLGTTRHLTA